MPSENHTITIMNSDTRSLTPRMIITLLVLSNIVSIGVNQFYQGLSNSLVQPLGHLLLGDAPYKLHFGPINLGLVIGSLVSGVFIIALGTFASLFLLKITWRFIAPAISKIANEGGHQ